MQRHQTVLKQRRRLYSKAGTEASWVMSTPVLWIWLQDGDIWQAFTQTANALVP